MCCCTTNQPVLFRSNSAKVFFISEIINSWWHREATRRKLIFLSFIDLSAQNDFFTTTFYFLFEKKPLFDILFLFLFPCNRKNRRPPSLQTAIPTFLKKQKGKNCSEINFQNIVKSFYLVENTQWTERRSIYNVKVKKNHWIVWSNKIIVTLKLYCVTLSLIINFTNIQKYISISKM